MVLSSFPARTRATTGARTLGPGVGVRWQWWFDDDRYNAYRGSLKVRAEYQQSLGGNLYERANGVLVGAEMTF